MIQNLFLISVSVIPLILLFLILSPLLLRRYGAEWRFWVFALLAIRLLIPYRPEFGHAPIMLPSIPDFTITASREEQKAPAESHAPSAAPSTKSETQTDSTPSIPSPPQRSLRELLSLVYLLGALGFGIYPILSYWAFLEKIRYDRQYLPTESPIPVYRFSRISSPMLIGYFRPQILIPNRNYSPEELSLILRHELQHRKRGDLWWKLLFVLVRAVHWWNPFVWLMVRRWEADMEYCCDNQVLKACNVEEKKLYSKTILKTMEE